MPTLTGSLNSYLQEVPGTRNRAALRAVLSQLLTDENPPGHQPIVVGQATTTGLTVSAATTTAVLLSGATTTQVNITGAFTTGISVAADGTTAMQITSAFTGTTGILLAGTATDGISITGACGDAISVSGTNTATAIHVSGTQVLGLKFEGTYSNSAVQIGTSGAAISLAAHDDHAIDIYTTCPSTDAANSVRPFYMKSTMAGIGGVGGRAEFHMYTNVALGGWSNAIKGLAEYGASGRTTGLGSAIVGETQLSAGTSSGTYCALEAEIVMPSGAVTGTNTSFLYCNATGAAASTFDTSGLMFEIGTGITPAAGKFASLTSQTLKCKVEANTRYMVLSQMEDGLGLGVSGTPMDLTTSTTQRAINVHTTSASTNAGTSIRPIHMISTMTGAGGVGGRAEFEMTTNVVLGGWCNAIKGYMNFGSSGGVTGLSSAICAEIQYPNNTVAGGCHSILELEAVIPASFVPQAQGMPAIYFNATTTPATMDTYGTLFRIDGLTKGAGKMFDDCTAAAASHALKISIGGTLYYIMLQSNVDA